MTAHDQHADIASTTAPPVEERPTDPSLTTPVSADPPADYDEPMADYAAEPSTSESELAASPTETSLDKALFADDELSALRSRWDDVQATFVDDPRDCVQKADALVSDVVQQLTTGFTEARSRLEAQWARGEEASTEDLRIALKRYREFFQRLLAV